MILLSFHGKKGQSAMNLSFCVKGDINIVDNLVNLVVDVYGCS